MVKTEQNYSYKHFVFKVENPNINKFISAIEHTYFEENRDKPVYIHVKMAEIVTTDNGYTIIIVEYNPIANIGNLISKYKEYIKETLICPDCGKTKFWPISEFCRSCFDEGREIKGIVPKLGFNE